MNTTKIKDYIAENTQWKKDTLIAHCDKNFLKIKFVNDLAILDYIDDLTGSQWNQFNSACRGLIIDLVQQEIVAHAFNKFESYNSNADILADLQAEVYITEKYDGSMITCYQYQDKVCCSTRSALSSEQSQQAQRILEQKYMHITDFLATGKYTVIFEYISPDNKVHVDYSVEDLVALAIRDLTTGELVSSQKLTDICKQYSLTQAKKIVMSLAELIQLAKTGKFESLEEGWIIKYDNQLIKLKSWEYLVKLKLIHYGFTKSKMIDKFLSLKEEEIEKSFARYPELIQEDAKDFYTQFKQDFKRQEEDIVATYNALPQMADDKEFALFVRKKHISVSKFLFLLRKDKCIIQPLKKEFPKMIDYYNQDAFSDIEKLQDWAFNYID